MALPQTIVERAGPFEPSEKPGLKKAKEARSAVSVSPPFPHQKQFGRLAHRRMAMTEIRTFPQGAPLRKLTPCAAENRIGIVIIVS